MTKGYRGGKDRSVPKELAPDLNLIGRQTLLIIWNRIRFLDQRIVDSQEKNIKPYYDIQERSALIWLLEKANLPFPQ